MLKNVLASLPRLTQKELEIVQAMVARLGRKPEDEEVPPLYVAMVTVLNSKVPYIRFKQQDVFKQWKLYYPGMVEFVAETWPDVSQDVVKLGLYSYLLGLLAEDLRRKGVPVLTRTMVLGLGNIPSLFDNAFPGYRASGLSHPILKRLVRA